MPVVGGHAHEGGDGLPVEGKLVIKGEGIAQAEVGSKLLDDVLLLVLFDVEQGELSAQGLEVVRTGDDDEQQVVGQENASKFRRIVRREDVEQDLQGVAGDGKRLLDAGDHEADVFIVASRHSDGLFRAIDTQVAAGQCGQVHAQVTLQLAEVVAFAAARVEDGNTGLAALNLLGNSRKAGQRGFTEVASDEFVDLVGKRGVVAAFQELAARLQHFFRIAGRFFEQQVDVLFPRNVEGVVMGTLEGAASSRWCG